MKTKKRVVGLILISIIGFIGYKITNKLQHKKEVEKRIQTLPNFSFKTVNGTNFTQKQLKNKPTVFIYFNSGCDYCKSEATKIKERLNEFKNAQLVFVSFEQTTGIIQFAKTHGLNNQENVIFLEDTKSEFSEIFDAKSIPYILVYNSNKQLLKKFKGATKISNILEVLN